MKLLDYRLKGYQFTGQKPASKCSTQQRCCLDEVLAKALGLVLNPYKQGENKPEHPGQGTEGNMSSPILSYGAGVPSKQRDPGKLAESSFVSGKPGEKPFKSCHRTARSPEKQGLH